MSGDTREVRRRAWPAGDEAHERRRAEIMARIPASYRPAIHLAVPSLVGLATLVGAAAAIRDLRPVELFAIPFTLLFAFGFEWRVHKDVLHRRRALAGGLYVRHELYHHVVFTHEDMAMRSPRELGLVLMPPYAIFPVFLVGLVPALVIARLVSWNSGCLFLATAMFFFVSYEMLHAAYHLPQSSVIGRLRLVARLREQHTRHHDPRLMKRWNFNVTVPVFDWIHRTAWSPEREAARAAARRGPARADEP